MVVFPDPGAGEDAVSPAAVDGNVPVVVQDASEFGDGWGLAGWSRLVVTPDGILRVTGAGDDRVFAADPGVVGVHDLAGEDFGTLRAVEDEYGNPTEYVYTDPHQDVWVYTSDGQLVAAADPHGVGLGEGLAVRRGGLVEAAEPVGAVHHGDRGRLRGQGLEGRGRHPERDRCRGQPAPSQPVLRSRHYFTSIVSARAPTCTVTREP